MMRVSAIEALRRRIGLRHYDAIGADQQADADDFAHASGKTARHLIGYLQCDAQALRLIDFRRNAECQAIARHHVPAYKRGHFRRCGRRFRTTAEWHGLAYFGFTR